MWLKSWVAYIFTEVSFDTLFNGNQRSVTEYINKSKLGVTSTVLVHAHN